MPNPIIQTLKQMKKSPKLG